MPPATSFQNPAAMLFSAEERALAEHARARLKLIAEHDEWFVQQKSMWAAEKAQRRHEDFQHQHNALLRPPELRPTALGQVVSEAAEHGDGLDRGAPPPPLVRQNTWYLHHVRAPRLPFGATRDPATVASGSSLQPRD